MQYSTTLRWIRGSLLVTISFMLGSARAADSTAEIRLYALDCGHFEVTDAALFSDTFEYDGKPHAGIVPCFVIKHPKGTLLWDTGMGDSLAQKAGGIVQGGIHMSLATTLPEELKAIGLAPADITFMAFSHFHFDHTGNANEFPASTWIINKTELAWAESKPGPLVNLDSFSSYKTVRKQMIDGDYDVFGDGRVRILKTPGHTPGHQSLLLKLQAAGTVVLSGDLYHTRENHQYGRVPTINTQRADTLASMARIQAILKNSKARLIIQHDLRDFAALPKFPEYLD
jgi:glyoxylase-like metal-dependent hydrolase (beta-lactamase superfamily II)